MGGQTTPFAAPKRSEGVSPTTHDPHPPTRAPSPGFGLPSGAASE
jgi:hypothetical protein